MKPSPLPKSGDPGRRLSNQEKTRSEILSLPSEAAFTSEVLPAGRLERSRKLIHRCARLLSNGVRSSPYYWVLVRSSHMCAFNRRSLVVGFFPPPQKLDIEISHSSQARQRQRLVRYRPLYHATHVARYPRAEQVAARSAAQFDLLLCDGFH
jgi:hypothetical protein